MKLTTPSYFLASALLLTGSTLPGPRARAQSPVELQREPVEWVNPYIGNISHLLVPTFPTVQLPNSMLRVVPERNDFTSSRIGGLPLLLTGHRGASVFSLKPFEGEESDFKPWVSYAYDQEKIQPYRYSVTLEEHATDVDFAPAHRAALYTFTHQRNRPHLYALTTGNGELKAQGSVISGFQRIDGDRTRAYIYLVFSATPQKTGAFENGVLRFEPRGVDGQSTDVSTAAGRDTGVVLSFAPQAHRIGVRYGVSFISVEQAKANLSAEITSFDLPAVARRGRAEWNQALGKIRVEGGSQNERTAFTTALYRNFERMIDISEGSAQAGSQGGRYFSGSDGKVHADGGTPFYTDDWIWDTYRASHPLQVLLNPQQERAKIASYIRSAQESSEGWMPTFPEVGGDAHAMNGNHAVAMIWDAYSKGVRGFDLAAAYESCRKSILEETMAPWMRRPAGDVDAFYKEHGYFPALKPGEKEVSPVVHGFERRQAVAVTLAASFDDWCLAQIARQLGKADDYKSFLARSYNYRRLFNPDTGFFHPKDADGAFLQPFDYKFAGGTGARDYYDENNGWTYRWGVEHNAGDLVRLMGGPEKFVANLDQTFAEPLGRGKLDFYNALPDQTGNVGQFTMGNEPSLHIPYLYNYAGAPWKTQKRVRSLLETWFRNDLMGIPGDEDGGGMSAFVVFSSLGFYPIVGHAAYHIGSPLFRRATIDLGQGRSFVIEAPNSSRENKYIQSARLNGAVWSKPWFRHSDIARGGRLELVLGSRPNTRWGSAPQDAPPSAEPLP